MDTNQQNRHKPISKEANHWSMKFNHINPWQMLLASQYQDRPQRMEGPLSNHTLNDTIIGLIQASHNQLQSPPSSNSSQH